jgi:molecular chaperone GrpE
MSDAINNQKPAPEEKGKGGEEMKKEPLLYTQKELDEEKKKTALQKEESDRNATEAAKWKNSYYLELADTQNLRKSLEKDHQEALRYRSEGFLENLLPALDSFYIALEATPQSPEAKNYQQGFSYIYNQIENALVSEGVHEILPKLGDPFDPKTMHAVDTKDGEKDGLVVQVYSKGYQLHDRLIRPVMVAVSKKKVEEVKSMPNEAAKKA